MTEKERSQLWRDKITKKLDSHKELQSQKIPELLGLIKKWQLALAASLDAGSKVTESFGKIAESIGKDNEWGTGISNITEQMKKIEQQEDIWTRALEEKFVLALNMTLPKDQKETLNKEKDVKKALTKYESVVKSKGTWARKELKKADSRSQAMNELNETVKDIEEKRTMIWKDLQFHCSQTYFIFLQAMCLTMRERCDQFDKTGEIVKSLRPIVDACQKTQPDIAGQPKKEEMAVIYGDEDYSKKKKDRVKSGTMGRKDASVLGEENEGTSAPGDRKPIPMFNRKEEAEKERAERKSSWGLPPGAGADPGIGDLQRAANGLGSPVPAKPQQTRVLAKWAFNAERVGELSMQAGDILNVLDQSNPNWWRAELNGATGVIPAPYVELLPPEPEPEMPEAPPPAPVIQMPEAPSAPEPTPTPPSTTTPPHTPTGRGAGPMGPGGIGALFAGGGMPGAGGGPAGGGMGGPGGPGAGRGRGRGIAGGPASASGGGIGPMGGGPGPVAGGGPGMGGPAAGSPGMGTLGRGRGMLPGGISLTKNDGGPMGGPGPSPAGRGFGLPVGGPGRGAFGGGAATPIAPVVPTPVPTNFTLPPVVLPDLPPPDEPALPDLPPPDLSSDFPSIELPDAPPVSLPSAVPPPVEEDDLPPPPLPREDVQQDVWEKYFTDAGHMYYYNPRTKESKWTLD